MTLPLVDVADVTCSPSLVRQPVDRAHAERLAGVFKALADPVRLQLVSLIAAHTGGEACVCDLNTAFDLSQPTISHHLRVLKGAGLVESERRATWVYYRVVPEMLDALSGLLAAKQEVPA